jgi:nucleotidyltransferase/DNA polymerase involved in DNA repair
MRAACVFIPHFPVAVELLARPDLRGRPLVIGGASEQRKAVLDCSPEAAALGVRPGRPLRQALALCPKASFLEPDPARYQDAFEAILRALEDISPLVEPADLGYAYVGVNGLDGLHRDEMAIGEALVPLSARHILLANALMLVTAALFVGGCLAARLAIVFWWTHGRWR